MPPTNPVGGYTIEVGGTGGSFVQVAISQNGDGCERLLPNPAANLTCLLATNLIPGVIAGSSPERVNSRTSVYDALVWRARASSDITVCARGLLTGGLLAQCEADAADADYLYESGDLRIRVLLGSCSAGSTPQPS